MTEEVLRRVMGARSNLTTSRRQEGFMDTNKNDSILVSVEENKGLT